MNIEYTSWELQMIDEFKLKPNTIGTMLKLQSIKEDYYLDYYYGDIALTILKRNLFILRNKEYTDKEVSTITNNKANYYKMFRNKRLRTDILNDQDTIRINYDINRIIKATIISKSDNDKYMNNSLNLAQGNFSYLTNIHNVFKLINKYNLINQKPYNDERAKLDNFYEQKHKELEDLEEYHRIIAEKWKRDLINGI